MTSDEARAWLSSRVSRETMGKLEVYHALLLQWQQTINLVAPSTLSEAWSRHFVDSAQLFNLAPTTATRWLDLGSGAGFPGLVIAVIAEEKRPELTMTLVESDVRKCGFLREAARKMGIGVHLQTQRIADIPAQSADVVSARALSNLGALLDHSSPHTTSGACLLFPKGSGHKAELETIPPRWQTIVETFQSETDPDAVVLRFTVPELEKIS